MAAPSYELLPAPGFTPTVGALVTMLEATRTSTLAAVNGLSASQIAHQHDATANPIGALLGHMTAIEWSYLVSTLEEGAPDPTEWATFGPLLRLSPAAWEAVRGRSLEALVDDLANVRARTLMGLARKDDAWLSQSRTLPWMTQPVSNLWVWYHVMEDELSHRGQIRWLRSRLPA